MRSRKQLESLRQKLTMAAGSEQIEVLADRGLGHPLHEVDNPDSLEAELQSCTDHDAEKARLDVIYSDETDLLRKVQNGDFEDLSDEDGLQLEAIVEREFRQVAFVTGGRFQNLPDPWTHLNTGDLRAAIDGVMSSIGRVERLSPSGLLSDHIGTGFMVGERLMMTNRHVAEVFVHGAGLAPLVMRSRSAGAFDTVREYDPLKSRDQPPKGSSDPIRISGVKMVHPYWDIALLELEYRPSNAGILSLLATAPEDMVGEQIVTIGYPGRGNDRRPEALELEDQHFRGIFGVKRIAPGVIDGRNPTRSYGRDVPAMIHDCSTLAGNSGSAIIHVKENIAHVVGIHFKGITLEANYSIPSYELARDKRVQDAGVVFAGNLPAGAPDWEPCWDSVQHPQAALSLTSCSVSIPANPPTIDSFASPMAKGEVADSSSGNSEATTVSCHWTLPLHVSVTVSLKDTKITPQVTITTEKAPSETPQGSLKAHSHA